MRRGGLLQDVEEIIVMKLLERLYIKEFFQLLGLAGLGMSVLLSLVNLIDRLGDFMKADTPAADLILYAVYNIPKNLFYLLPMTTLVCGLFVVSGAVRKSELIVIKAAGGKMRGFLAPFIAVGAMISGFALFLGEFVMPVTLERAEDLRVRYSSAADGTQPSAQRRRLSMIEGQIWMKDRAGSILRIGVYSFDGLSANDVTRFRYEDGNLAEQINAGRMSWEGDGWVLYDVQLYRLREGTMQFIASMPYPELEEPGYFKDRLKKTEEMRIGEMFNYLRRLKQSGYTNPKLVVDFNSRLAYPLVNLFMMVIGVSLPLRGRKVKGLAATGIGLGISLFYWGGYILGLSLGNAGVVPPYIAPWIMPLLFSALSAALFKSIPE